jgi:hypothetical protein
MPAQVPDFTYSCQASAEHFEQCAEFPLLCNRGLGPLASPWRYCPLRLPGGRRYTHAHPLPSQSTFRLSSGSSRRYGST